MKTPKFVIGIVVLLSMLLVACSGPSTNNTENNPNVLCDVEKFANISSAELVALLGEPDNVEKTTTNGFAEFPCVYYEYNNTKELGEVSFILINDSVVKLVSYHSYAYNEGKEILECFNLSAGEHCAADKKDTYARYRCVTDKVDDLWITLIDKDSDTFESLQVTYDMFYFEEWYIPMATAEQSDYQYWTKEGINSILKSPSTAKYPSILEWKFGNNLFYVAVQSYVDAQNSFGAQVRSEFYFVYLKGTHELVYAIFDGEVIVDNGYVATKELVAELIDNEKTDGAIVVPHPTPPDTTPSETVGNQLPTTPTTIPTEPSTNPTDEPTESTSPHTHTYGDWSASNKGRHERICTACNDIEYAEHTWDDGTVTQAATCAADGIMAYTCNVCGSSKTEAIAKTNEHTWDGGMVTQAATCAADGVMTYTCTVCNCSKTEAIIKTDDHAWDNGQVTQKATCSEEGVITYICQICFKGKTEVIKKSEHDFSQRVEDIKYLKSSATFYCGTTYYYSCSCGAIGLETFSLDDRKEWISEEELKELYGFGCAWMGEYIWIGKTDYSTNTEYRYKIYGSPTSKMEAGVIYDGNYDGNLVRFKSDKSIYYGSSIYFYFDDLVAVGII